MAQTTNAISWVDCVIRLSEDAFATELIDISGFANSLKVSGGERAVSEFFTASGDTPILTRGKRSALEVSIVAVYTEGLPATDPFEKVRALYESGGPLYIRWQPKGEASTGKFMFTTSAGFVTKPIYPQGAADSADALSFELTLKVASITKSLDVTP